MQTLLAISSWLDEHDGWSLSPRSISIVLAPFFSVQRSPQIQRTLSETRNLLQAAAVQSSHLLAWALRKIAATTWWWIQYKISPSDDPHSIPLLGEALWVKPQVASFLWLEAARLSYYTTGQTTNFCWSESPGPRTQRRDTNPSLPLLVLDLDRSPIMCQSDVRTNRNVIEWKLE